MDVISYICEVIAMSVVLCVTIERFVAIVFPMWWQRYQNRGYISRSVLLASVLFGLLLVTAYIFSLVFVVIHLEITNVHAICFFKKHIDEEKVPDLVRFLNNSIRMILIHAIPALIVLVMNVAVLWIAIIRAKHLKKKLPWNNIVLIILTSLCFLTVGINSIQTLCLDRVVSKHFHEPTALTAVASAAVTAVAAV
jgi:hypothetical protein